MSDGDFVWKLLGLISLIANIAMGYATWISRKQSSTQIEGNVNVRDHKDAYITKGHHDKEIARLDRRVDECHISHKDGDGRIRDDVEKLAVKLDDAKDALQLEASRRSGGLHKRMDESDKVLSAVDERSKSTDSTVRMMHQNILELVREKRS